MHNFTVSKDKKKQLTMMKGERWKDMVVGKVVAHLCLTLIIK